MGMCVDERREGVKFGAFGVNFEDVNELVTYNRGKLRNEKRPQELGRIPFCFISESSVQYLG
jgi:hypothetical protein